MTNNDKANICITYRRQKYNRWVSFWDRWKPLDLHIRPWRYWRGNIKTFGFWSGFKSNIALTLPLLNMIIHWKYRNMHLDVPYTTRDTLSIIKGGKDE